MKIERQIEDLMAEVSNAQRAGDNEELARLSFAQVELTRRKATILPRDETAETSS
jgi:hypothetical protein